ncbi:putative Lipase esterase family protein [Seiridium cardinale]|uniref:Lipase esterase family protein n=1 Tax=Seiridium cardinale TaxID=138064 RepID=A0ABR2XTK3_9PEZI
MSPEWARVAPEHEKIERVIETLYSLPIAEFRKVPYRPPPMSTDVPIPGRDISIREAKVPVRDGHDISIRIYEPLNLGQNHMLFFNIHGGGWTVGSPETEEAQNRLIAARNEAVVVSVDYRKYKILVATSPAYPSLTLFRAPEYPFPYALNDCYDVLLWCISSSESLGVEKDSIILGGGSAGANIVAALAQIVRDEGINGIIGQVLNIPVTCHPDHFPRSEYEYGSYTQNANAPIVNAARMRLYWSYYLPSGAADPRASPLLASSLAGLPPALIQVAGMDPLRDEGLAYAQALKDSGHGFEAKLIFRD